MSEPEVALAVSQDTIDNFWVWAEGEMAKRNLTWYAVERKSGLSSGAISRRANNGMAPTDTTCTALAHVFGLSPDLVFRRAGLLPQPTTRESDMQDIIDLLKHLPDEELARVEVFVESLYRYVEELKDQAAAPEEEE
jgi:transcriptional regulator with XRE-family HTH domain